MKIKGEREARRLLKIGRPVGAVCHLRTKNPELGISGAKALLGKWRRHAAPRMRDFRIECGDSNAGTVGFVAYVSAESRAGALAALTNDMRTDGHEIRYGLAKVVVYFNPANVKLSEISRA